MPKYGGMYLNAIFFGTSKKSGLQQSSARHRCRIYGFTKNVQLACNPVWDLD